MDQPTGDCIFCKIVAGQIPAELVHRDEGVSAFRDISPQAPVHLLIVPDRHLGGLAAAGAEHRELLGGLLLTAAELARRLGVAEGGYRVVVNSGADGGQSVGHLHLHLLGGRPLAWPPG